MHETFWTLLGDSAHWEFEIFLMVVFDGLIGCVCWPFIRKHWAHHVTRDRRDAYVPKQMNLPVRYSNFPVTSAFEIPGEDICDCGGTTRVHSPIAGEGVFFRVCTACGRIEHFDENREIPRKP